MANHLNRVRAAVLRAGTDAHGHACITAVGLRVGPRMPVLVGHHPARHRRHQKAEAPDLTVTRGGVVVRNTSTRRPSCRPSASPELLALQGLTHESQRRLDARRSYH